MADKIFISCATAQVQWVMNDLLPIFTAAGADVLGVSDYQANAGALEQIEAANMVIPVLSPEYIENATLQREMDVATDNAEILPILFTECDLPPSLSGAYAPELVDLRDLQNRAAWEQLMTLLKLNAGVHPLDWLAARDIIKDHFREGRSVYLHIRRKYVKWRELLQHLKADIFKDAAIIDLQSDAANSRSGFIELILQEADMPTVVPDPPNDLITLEQKLRLASTRHLMFRGGDRDACGDPAVWEVLHGMAQDGSDHVLLIQSREILSSWMRKDHPLLHPPLQVVELG